MYMCLYTTKFCFMTLVIGEMWLHAPLDPFCSCQPFQHRWWCLGAVAFGALKVTFVVCRSQATSQEIRVWWRLLQATACSAPQPPSAQGCGALVRGERKGKSMVSPTRKGHSVCVEVSTTRLRFHRALLLMLLSGGGGAPPLAWDAGGGPAPKPSPAAAPAHASPCGPCIPACCWASLSLQGTPILSLPGIPTARLLPSWLLLLLKSSCAKALCRGCRFGLP